MHKVLQDFNTMYVESKNLMPLLSEYANPRDFIARLVQRGELIRLKNGFFLIAENMKKSAVPYEQIANLMYGPSYVSMEWALSQYGMIPEGVYVVTSVTVAQSKQFMTPIGALDYVYLSHARYVVGCDQKKNGAGSYLIATPEKALADLVHFKSKHLSPKELLIDLIEGRRIEEENLKSLNKKHLLEISEQYRSESVHVLVNTLGLL